MNPILPDPLSNDILQGLDRLLPVLSKALIGLLVGFVVIRLLSWFGQLVLNLISIPKGLRQIMTSMLDGLLWVFLAVWFLDALGLDKLAIVFSGSIAALGLALASGAGTLAADILAGVFLAKDRDFSIGDQIIAGEKGTEGIVETMDMRRTRLRTKDGRLHVIPNSVIERHEWVLVTKKKDLPKS